MDYKNLKSYKAEAGIKVEKQRREQRQQGGAACGGQNFFMKNMKQEGELTVITRAKDLCSYIMTITQKSPRHFRYTFVTRLQNLSLSILGNLFRANDEFVSKENYTAAGKRLEYQRCAMSELKILAYFSMLAMEQGCILSKQGLCADAGACSVIYIFCIAPPRRQTLTVDRNVYCEKLHV